MTKKRSVYRKSTVVVVHYSEEWGEYQVPDPSGRSTATYFTDDKQDAIDTAKVIWREHEPVTVKIRRIK